MILKEEHIIINNLYDFVRGVERDNLTLCNSFMIYDDKINIGMIFYLKKYHTLSVKMYGIYGIKYVENSRYLINNYFISKDLTVIYSDSNGEDFIDIFHNMIKKEILSKNVTSNIYHIIKDFKKDKGKLIKDDYGIYMCLGIAASDEDYYRVYLSENGEVGLYSCVGGYNIINDKKIYKEFYKKTKKQLKNVLLSFNDTCFIVLITPLYFFNKIVRDDYMSDDLYYLYNKI